MKGQIKNIVIAGGGTAGWMAAIVLARFVGHATSITLVESDEIPSVGVGEATIPTLRTFHELVEIDEQAFMRATNATFKLSIAFDGWYKKSAQYFHSFGFLGEDSWAAGFQHYWQKGLALGVDAEIGDYCLEHLASREGKCAFNENFELNRAYHMDAGLYAKYLRELCEALGVQRCEGKIKDVLLSSNDGSIKALQLESGKQIDGDLFIDCTGFSALLIDKALSVDFDDWSHFLPCDSAWAVQSELAGEPVPYTRAIAHDSGWQWQIPLQNRMGNGLVFASDFLSEDRARACLMENLPAKPSSDPRLIKFRTGVRKKQWYKNCLAVGLAGGFLEPLESTGIHLIQRAMVKLILHFPINGIRQADVDEFNNQMHAEYKSIRDLLVCHYSATARVDTKFWRQCQSMPVPDSLRERIEYFKETGRVFKRPNDLFSESSWVQVFLGQGIKPEGFHPIVGLMSDVELCETLERMQESVRRAVISLPKHADFLKDYCASSTN